MAEQGKTIVLAEDDVVLQEMYTERLKTEGYNVLVAHDGREALDHIEKGKPDLIMLDIMMPQLNGIDVLKRLKASEETKNTPVIVATALVQDIDELKKMLGSKDSYLIKSEVTPGEIIELVKQKLAGEEKSS